eukprot:jgi/Psemu1/35465/gm1.35465_g
MVIRLTLISSSSTIQCHFQRLQQHQLSPHASVPFTNSTPAVHNSPPTTACKTTDHPTAGSPETSIGIHGIHKSDSIADSTPTGTSSYTWKYSPSTDSVRFRRIAYSSTPSIVPADIPTGDVLSKRNREPYSTCARTSYPSPANSRWTFYPQSETVVFHRTQTPVSSPQPSCISALQLPPSGALFKGSVVPSSVRQPLYGAPICPIWKPLYGAHSRQLYGAHSMNNLPVVCITRRHRDAIKLKLYQLHATLLIANWLYDDVT